MKEIQANQILDAQGFACPVPVVKTKKKIEEMNSGEVLEIKATDQGSTADIKAWTERAGHDYLGTIEDGNQLKHYIRKCSEGSLDGKKHPHTITNDQLKEVLKKEGTVLLDVREQAEYAFGHIPQAVSVPLGELEERMDELNKKMDVYVVCRSGARSDLAAQLLTENGFEKVFNVLPGMSGWTGETKK